MITELAPRSNSNNTENTVRLTLSHEIDRLKSNSMKKCRGQARKAAGFLICMLANLGDFVRRWEVYIAQTQR